MFHPIFLYLLIASASIVAPYFQEESVETRRTNGDLSYSEISNSMSRLQSNDRGVGVGGRVIRSTQEDSTVKFPKSILKTPPGCGIAKKDVPKVTGGRFAQKNSLPWMASFSTSDHPIIGHQNSRSSFCGGTLISDRHVLTAAHCFKDKKNRWMIKPLSELNDRVYQLDDRVHLGFGSIDREEHWNYNGSDIQFIQIHEGYDKGTQENDIALVTLKEPLSFDDEDTQPICLPVNSNYARQFSFENSIARIAGWGHILSNNTAKSNFLLQADIPVIGLVQCKKAYENGKYKVTDKNICAMAPGVDACRGDSGGPLMYETAENRWIIIGIISWGSENCDGSTPGVYTRVTSYLEWIEKKQIFHDEMDQRESFSSALFRIKKLEDIVAIQLNQVNLLNRPPSSCHDLMAMGHLHSGFYHVQGSNGVDSVYCDMSKAVNDNGFESRIGRVEIKSKSIFFYVSRMSEFSVKETVIPFEMEVMNIGDAMNTRKGVFTAPVGGIYFFSFTGVKSESSQRLNVELRLNGKKWSQGYARSVDEDFTLSTISLQSTLQLRPGDEVDVFLYLGSLWSKYNTTQFIGFLVEQNF